MTHHTPSGADVQTVYVRARLVSTPDLAHEIRDPGHWIVGRACPLCLQPFRLGQWVYLVPLGPGDDEANRAKARDLGVLEALALPAHLACATGWDDFDAFAAWYARTVFPAADTIVGVSETS